MIQKLLVWGVVFILWVIVNCLMLKYVSLESVVVVGLASVNANHAFSNWKNTRG
jgi:hypothetical protein